MDIRANVLTARPTTTCTMRRHSSCASTAAARRQRMPGACMLRKYNISHTLNRQLEGRDEANKSVPKCRGIERSPKCLMLSLWYKIMILTVSGLPPLSTQPRPLALPSALPHIQVAAHQEG